MTLYNLSTGQKHRVDVTYYNPIDWILVHPRGGREVVAFSLRLSQNFPFATQSGLPGDFHESNA